jgi:hypothetical protein
VVLCGVWEPVLLERDALEDTCFVLSAQVSYLTGWCGVAPKTLRVFVFGGVGIIVEAF